MKALWERWRDAVSALPPAQRPPQTDETQRVLERVFRFAPAQGEFIVGEPSFFKTLIEHDLLDRDRTHAQFQRSWTENPDSGLPQLAPLARVRRWKKREFFRIAARDIADKAGVDQTMAELSSLASVCVQAVLEIVWEQLAARHPPPGTPFCVLGMGKLGGFELNYSSDIDLIYVYEEEGQTDRITHHEWFMRLAQALTQELTKRDEHGSLFRVDLRLRPEGGSGPIVHSLDACEHYYAAHGETWERLALIKARGIAGDAELAYEFCQRLQPFVYPRFITSDVVEEVHQTKKRIENEIVGQDALHRHVKLGRGGIREIEFITQTLQLLHGAKHPFLQENGTLKALAALHRLDLLGLDVLDKLVAAYRCFRMVEHRLQMRFDLQTHTLPPDWEESADLHESLGYPSAEAFSADLKSRQREVRGVFTGLLEDGRSPESGLVSGWPDAPTAELLEELRGCGFQEPTQAYSTLRSLAQGPEFVHTATRTRILFDRLWPLLKARFPREARPDLCLKQFERFIEAYGTRSALFEILLRRPKLLEILFLIFDNSRYLTDTIIRHPEFIEDIALTGTLDYRKSPEDVRKEIDAQIGAGTPVEKVLRLTKRSELLRIELRAMTGKSTLDVTMAEWSELGEVSLQVGVDHFGFNRDFAIVAMGKFAGRELSNGSDLDIVFIGDDPKRAVKIIKLMNDTTEDGIVFPVDTRLRPYGNDGLLAVPIETFQDYYASKAQLWEKLALTRARAIAGDPGLMQQYEQLVAGTLYRKPIGAAELEEVFRMRQRIETERSTHNPKFPADYKTGRGGLVDLEFLTQASQLMHGTADPAWRSCSTLELLELGGRTILAENYLFLRKMEFSLRRFHLTEEASIPNDQENQWILARHMGFSGFDEFLEVYRRILDENRAAFDEFKKTALGGQR